MSMERAVLQVRPVLGRPHADAETGVRERDPLKMDLDQVEQL